MNKNLDIRNSNNTQRANIVKNSQNNARPRQESPIHYQNGYTGNSIFGIVLLIVVILLVLYATYWAYNVYSSKTFETSISVDVMKDVKDASSKFAIGSGSIPSSKYSNEYSISMWLNIQDYTYNYGKEKIILRRGDSGSPNLEILLGEKENDLIVRLKLQGTPTIDSGIISKFQDVLPSQENEHEHENSHGTFDLQHTTTKLENCNNKVYEKISGNDINYTTIKYNSNSGCDDFSTDNLKNADNMTIIMKQAMQTMQTIHNPNESFKDCSNEQSKCNNYKNVIDSLAYSDMSYVSDNSAPIESQGIHNEYFKLVSGNEVQPCPTKQIENFNISQFDDIPSVISNTTTTSPNITVSMASNTTNTTTTTTTATTTTSANNTLDKLDTGKQNISCNLSKGVLYNLSNNKDLTLGTCIYKQLPMQKWVHVIVSVYNQVVDIYVDGQLGSSCVIQGYPAISNLDVNLTPDGGFSGQISRVSFSNTAMTVGKSQDLYYAGPIASENILSMIPSWIWYTIIIIIVVAILYSFVM